mmetsp:Transcript_5190/g.11610  ORF Transcript_5190/g.11610 Transcript_5190/m.11610 type:complete len:102 (-) Transcript_5190:89-394(-)
MGGRSILLLSNLKKCFGMIMTEHAITCFLFPKRHEMTTMISCFRRDEHFGQTKGAAICHRARCLDGVDHFVIQKTSLFDWSMLFAAKSIHHRVGTNQEAVR